MGPTWGGGRAAPGAGRCECYHTRTLRDTSASARVSASIAAFAEALRAGDSEAAAATARELLRGDTPTRVARRIRDILEAAGPQAGGFRPWRVELVASFNGAFVHDAVIAHGATESLRVSILPRAPGHYAEAVLDPASALYQRHPLPDATVFALEGNALFPELCDGIAELRETERKAAVAAALHHFEQLIDAYRERSAAPLLVHDLAPPRFAGRGILDASSATGEIALVHTLNAAIRAAAALRPGVHVIDYAGLVARHGARNWYDDRLRHLADFPIASAFVPELAREWLKYFRALAGKTRKALVVDLDGTLWGGVLAEDGLDGITLGPTHPGSAYVEFQRAVLGLRRRGVILAIASHNHRDDVARAFVTHPHMQLRLEDFAEVSTGWGSKAEAIAAMAERLGLPLAALVFADDDAVVCAEVRARLPSVVVLHLPKPPEERLETLLGDGLFDALATTPEDRERTTLYHRRAAAERLREATPDLETFYRELKMTVRFAPLSTATLARAAQLTERTHQFNATARRRSEADFDRLRADPAWFTMVVALRDRFGDHGIVGLALARADPEGRPEGRPEALHIDTFLLSCRVLGRSIEIAMLAEIVGAARVRGLKCVRGEIVPAPRNQPVRSLFERGGFSLEKSAPAPGPSQWIMDLENAQNLPSAPPWLEIVRARADGT